MRAAHKANLILLGILNFFSLAATGLAAATIGLGMTTGRFRASLGRPIRVHYNLYQDSFGLMLAANALTFIFGIIMFCVFLFGSNPEPAKWRSVTTELIILFICWVLEMAAGIKFSLGWIVRTGAMEGVALTAFALTWVNFALLLVLFIVLLSWAISNRNEPRGDGSIWAENTRDHDFGKMSPKSRTFLDMEQSVHHSQQGKGVQMGGVSDISAFSAHGGATRLGNQHHQHHQHHHHH